MPPSIAHYLEGVPFDPEDYAREVARAAVPLDSADQGSVFVNWIRSEADEWVAVWERGEEHRSLNGTRAEVVAWARAQEASRYWIFSSIADDYVPLQLGD